MHVLVTNDDGPPGEDSPYVDYFIRALQENTDWDISVALPDCQKSWIGKAHFIGKTITASYITPSKEVGGDYEGPYYKSKADGSEEWVLLDGTPATCSQIGIHHLFKEKGPVDLVISGPNYGRNSTAIFILSSGTIGAAMEGALCGVKSIGISYAYSSRVHDPKQIALASRVSVNAIKHLYFNWPEDGSVDLYSINVPLNPQLTEDVRYKYTSILPNRWGAAFEYVEDQVEISETGVQVEATERIEADLDSITGRLQFKWMPNLKAVNDGVTEEPAGNDGFALINGYVSVTPLKANFQGVPGYEGEFTVQEKQVSAVVGYPEDSYIYPLLMDALATEFPEARVSQSLDGRVEKLFHYTDYEDLDFDRLMVDQTGYLSCSYVYRKALIRKNFLAHAIKSYRAKHPETILATHFPESYELELDYAEYLDEMLDDIYEFRDELDKEQEWWILKPSMSDRGQGIRIFKTRQQLQDIFDSFEEPSDDDEGSGEEIANGVVTSQIRHFLIQKYIMRPILLATYGNRKFHIRTYVVASGALDVYVFKDMLALFALRPYTSPDENTDLDGHLTNTCLQGENRNDGSVQRFWKLSDTFDKQLVWSQICAITAETFAAATSLGRLHFQPVPNAFEIYGVDFLVSTDENGDLITSLLEINAYPDFGQTGDDLKELVGGLFKAVVGEIVRPFFGHERYQVEKPADNTHRALKKVYSENLSGGW
ncbi:tubulin-tyrosine ligase family-domain-containing protein [Lipomyces oligophaga]|uniref:tubulin-tyrosine ligase family-domain-containing protein n=1 Tax=Lipomyces oligophaga TaxID=45792 RepID=UPI0034CDA657